MTKKVKKTLKMDQKMKKKSDYKKHRVILSSIVSSGSAERRN